MADNVISVQFGAETAPFNRGIEQVKAQAESLNQRLNASRGALRAHDRERPAGARGSDVIAGTDGR
jgi:hypothetical protein